MIFFGVGVPGKTIIVFSLAVFPFIFNACAGVRAVDRLLINVVRSLGGGEWDLYRKVLLPSVLPYVVAAARIAIGRALIGVSGRRILRRVRRHRLRHFPLRRPVRHG